MGTAKQPSSTNNKNPETETGVQPEKPKKQSSQATREVLPLPRLDDHKQGRLSLSLLSFYTLSSAGIKGI